MPASSRRRPFSRAAVVVVHHGMEGGRSSHVRRRKGSPPLFPSFSFPFSPSPPLSLLVGTRHELVAGTRGVVCQSFDTPARSMSVCFGGGSPKRTELGGVRGEGSFKGGGSHGFGQLAKKCKPVYVLH